MRYFKIFTINFLICSVFFLNTSLKACRPAEGSLELKNQVKNAENIFVGKILKAKDFSENFGSFEITVQVVRPLKSSSKKGDIVTVTTKSNSAACGYDEINIFAPKLDFIFFTDFNFETTHLSGNQKVHYEKISDLEEKIKEILNLKEEKIIAQYFNDVTYNHKNKRAIDYIREQEIVSGYEDGTFKPQNTINRAEFTKIIVKSQFHPLEIKHCPLSILKFSDVKKTDWFAPFICVAKINNLIEGYDDETFKPEKNILFTESAKIISEAFKLSKKEGRNWFEGYFLALENISAIPLSIKKSSQSITRGEMAELIYRIKAKITNQPTQSTKILIPECAGDLKVCKNGSMVKRIFPSCQFQTCPQ